MADNTQLNATTNPGDTIATEDIGEVKHQLIKMEFGAPGAATKVSETSPLPTVDKGVSAVESSVPAAIASTELLAANSARVNATIRNDSTATLYLSMGGTASSSSPLRLLAQDIYELPCRYTGAINGIWDSATGNARVLEFS